MSLGLVIEGVGLFWGLCLQEEWILRQDDPRVGAVEARKCDELERAMEKTQPEIECFVSQYQDQQMLEDGDAASNEEVRGA